MYLIITDINVHTNSAGSWQSSTGEAPTNHNHHQQYHHHYHGEFLIASTRVFFMSCVILSSSATRCRSLMFSTSSRHASSSMLTIRCFRVSLDLFDAALFLRLRSAYLKAKSSTKSLQSANTEHNFIHQRLEVKKSRQR